MTDCVVLIPVLNRPHRAAPVVESITTTSDARIVFIVSPDDHAEIHAVEAVLRDGDFMLGAPWPQGPGDYARKINLAVEETDEPLIFLGADDLIFHPEWLEHARAKARGAVGVIGTNDLGSPRVKQGRHSTHSLITREYVEKYGTIDQPGLALHEGYRHNFVDDELVNTAKVRRAWSFARLSHVEHLHPSWGKAETDPTYKLGLSGFEKDRATFNKRRRLWGQRERR